jgi:hypothetical protein
LQPWQKNGAEFLFVPNPPTVPPDSKKTSDKPTANRLFGGANFGGPARSAAGAKTPAGANIIG